MTIVNAIALSAALSGLLGSVSNLLGKVNALIITLRK